MAHRQRQDVPQLLAATDGGPGDAHPVEGEPLEGQGHGLGDHGDRDDPAARIDRLRDRRPDRRTGREVEAGVGTAEPPEAPARIVTGQKRVVGAEAPGLFELRRLGVDRGHTRARQLRQLNPVLAEAAAAEHGAQLARRQLGLANGPLGGHPGAEQRRRRDRVEPLGDRHGEGLLDHRILGEGAIHVVAVGAAVPAEALEAGQAFAAGKTGVVDPRQAEAGAFLEASRGVRPGRDQATDPLVAQGQRQGVLGDGLLALADVEVGVSRTRWQKSPCAAICSGKSCGGSMDCVDHPRYQPERWAATEMTEDEVCPDEEKSA